VWGVFLFGYFIWTSKNKVTCRRATPGKILNFDSGLRRNDESPLTLTLSPKGRGNKQAYSINSSQCTTGTPLPAARCAIHPIFADTITSGAPAHNATSFSSRNCRAISG
jgi:hypothetical protein